MATKLEIKKVDPGRSPEYGKEMSGRCHKCNSRFLWARKLGKLKDMLCPFCNKHLSGTTHLFNGDTYELNYPIEIKGAKVNV
jgi:hypothetical protein